MKPILNKLFYFETWSFEFLLLFQAILDNLKYENSKISLYFLIILLIHKICLNQLVNRKFKTIKLRASLKMSKINLQIQNNFQFKKSKAIKKEYVQSILYMFYIFSTICGMILLKRSIYELESS